MDAPVTSITIGDVNVPPMTQERKQQHLDPLAYQAEAVQGDVKAQIIIRHYGDARYPGGYLLHTFFLRTNEDAPGRMGYKQEARARSLLATLEKKVEDALLAAGWVKRWKTPQDADLWLYVGSTDAESAKAPAREQQQPEIAIDYERLKANVPGRLAGLQDQGMFASAWMDPVERGQWPRGGFIPRASVLVYHYERVAEQGSMGALQEEQGRKMCQRLRERLPDELRAGGWQVVSKTRDGQDIWQHRPGTPVEHPAPEQDGQAEQPQEELPDIDLSRAEPVSEVCQADEQLEQTNYQEQLSHVVEVIGSEEAKLRGQQPAYSREVWTREVTFTCIVCLQTVTQQRYPGHTPLYCSDSCKGERQREKTRERVARHRENQKSERSK